MRHVKITKAMILAIILSYISFIGEMVLNYKKPSLYIWVSLLIILSVITIGILGNNIIYNKKSNNIIK